jgi:enoyl-CoA hydratase
MSYETLIVETKGAVTIITLNRPQALNALNAAVMEEMVTALAAYEADEGQRCAIVTGQGVKALPRAPTSRR